jgi:hypothetical protein
MGMGFDTTYYTLEDARTYGFGFNADGRLGTGTSEPFVTTPMPVKSRGILDHVDDLTEVNGIVRSGLSSQCAWLEGNRYYCWGTDKEGDLGLGSPSGQNQMYATLVSRLPGGAANMVRGESHVCVTVATGDNTEIWCYGNGDLVGHGHARSGDIQFDAAPVVWAPRTGENDAAP